MSLSAELARPVPKLARPRSGRTKSALESAADQIALAFGGVPKDDAPTRDVLAEVEAILGPDGAGLSKLVRSQLKFVPYLIWGPKSKWQVDVAFLDRYLARVAEAWPNGTRRLWRHYVLNFETESVLTQRLGIWLVQRRGSLPEPMRRVSDDYRILEATAAPGTLATAVLQSGKLLDELAQVGLNVGVLRSTSFAVEILAAAGRHLTAGAVPTEVPLRLSSFLGGVPKDAIRGAACSAGLQQAAMRDLVDGLVAWQRRSDPNDAEFEPTLDFLLAINGDPRFVRDRWYGKVGSGSIATVERWLSKATIEGFFRVIDTLKTDSLHWEARRAFWLSYLPHVTGAWLIAGPNAVPLAKRQDIRFGRFDRKGTDANHCGLMLQIGDAYVIEMNMNGSAIIWRAGTRGLPGLYEGSYNRRQYWDRKDDRDVFVLTHNVGWQQRFKDRIMQLTGIDVR